MGRPLSRKTLALAALLLVFAVSGALRLNGFCLLEPDSPEYLFGAKSLASLDGYRELDRPGAPLHTFRPPGLPLLLVPLAWIAPYSVAGAKSLILATALVAIALTVVLAWRGGGGAWGGLAAGILVASSPYALLHATEVVAEFPYLACALGAILLITRGGDPPSRRDLAAAAALLAFLPFLRTIGVALVAAVGLACALDRRMRPWWPAPAAGLAATAAWMLRNQLAGGPTYFGAIAADLGRVGPAAFAAKAADAAAFYASRFLDVLLPAVWPGRPLFERMTVGGTPDLGGLYGAGWIAGIVAVGLAAWGIKARWRREGLVIAVYAALYVGILAVYPPRHERLMWPLVPLVWAMAPAGLAAARGAGVTGRVATGGLAAAAAALCAWQGAAALAMVRDNGAWRREGERFYERRVPPLYFADWRAAGSWLGAHAPRGTRVLTRHSDTGFASGLSQESARFEELPPPIWRARIAQLSARYLAVPTTLYGRFFPLELLRSDPVYTYEVVWRGRDVAVVEVRPNRNGRVEPAPPPSPEVQAACAQALAREPRRVDLAARCAELDAAAGRRDEAIARLRELIATGGADVRLHVALAQMLLDAGKDAEAAAAFTTASALPEAELLEQTIARGRSAALERAGTRSIDMDVRARQAVGRARDDMERLRWAEAYAKVGEALGLAPDDPVVLRAAGDLALPLGALDRAVAFYEAAGARGDGASAERAAGLRDALAVERAFETAAPEAVTRAAIFWGKAGAPGRALDLLERAAGRLAADEGVARRLAEARRFFGHPPP